MFDLEIKVVLVGVGAELDFLDVDDFWLRLASCARLLCLYLNLPKSMIRQTGGLEFGETSTKSIFFSWAISKASWVGMVPSRSPSSAITSTSLTRIMELIRCFLLM